MPDILGTTGSKSHLYESDDSPVWCPVPAVGATELREKLTGAKASYLLDVRQPEEYCGGHVAGARLIRLGELETRLGEVPKDREIACICASGSRSVAAARKLMAAGYTASSLTGGMMTWQRANLPVKTGSAR
jgi:rhodanese-related sulfurtransferase